MGYAPLAVEAAVDRLCRALLALANQSPKPTHNARPATRMAAPAIMGARPGQPAPVANAAPVTSRDEWEGHDFNALIDEATAQPRTHAARPDAPPGDDFAGYDFNALIDEVAR